MREVGLDEVLAGLPAGLPLPVGCWLVARVAIAMGSEPRLLAPETVRIGEDGSVRLGDGPQEVPFHLRSPESIRGGDVDDASAVFNLGGLLVHTLSGRAPFLRGSDMETRLAVTEEAIAKLVGRVSQASAALDDIVAKALEKDARARFRTSVQLGEALHAFLEEELHEADAGNLAEIAKTALEQQPTPSARKPKAKAIGAIATRKKAVRRDPTPRHHITEVDAAVSDNRSDNRSASVRPEAKAAAKAAAKANALKAAAKAAEAKTRAAEAKTSAAEAKTSAAEAKTSAAEAKKGKTAKARGNLRADRRIGGLRKPVSAPPERMAPSAEEGEDGLPMLPMPRSLAPPAPDAGMAPPVEPVPFGDMPPSLETPLEDYADELELPLAQDHEESLELDAFPVEERAGQAGPSARAPSSRPAAELLQIDETAMREESSYVPPERQPIRRPPPQAEARGRRAGEEEDYVDDDVGTAWVKPVGLVLFGLLALAIVYQFLVRPLLAALADG